VTWAKTPGARLAACLGLVGLLAVSLRVASAVALPNIYHPDEIFQSVEQAHRLIYGIGFVPWEFVQGVRSWILPGLIAGPMWLGGALFGAPQGYVWSIAVALSLLSAAPVICAFLLSYERHGKIWMGTLAGLGCATWADLIYFGPKPLAEVVSGNLLVLAVFLSRPEVRASSARLVFSGVIFGLAGAVRPHLVPAILLAAIWHCRFAWKARWIPVATGVLAAAIAAGLLDWATWGAPFESYIAYFRTNVVEGRASLYGVLPWYSYVAWLIDYWSWGLPFVALMILVGAWKRPVFLAMAAAIVLSHSLVPHKEYRFIFPAVLCAIVDGSIGLAEVALWLSASRSARSPWAAATLLAILWLGASTAAATSNSFRPNWTRRSGFIEAFLELSHSDSACGVGLWKIGWGWADTGGYTYLHRPIPVLDVQNDADFWRSQPRFNYVLAYPQSPPPGSAYQRRACWDAGLPGRTKLCLYRRPQGCGP